MKVIRLSNRIQIMKIKQLKNSQNLSVGYDGFSLVLTYADERWDQWHCQEFLSNHRQARSLDFFVLLHECILQLSNIWWVFKHPYVLRFFGSGQLPPLATLLDEILSLVAYSSIIQVFFIYIFRVTLSLFTMTFR